MVSNPKDFVLNYRYNAIHLFFFLPKCRKYMHKIHMEYQRPFKMVIPPVFLGFFLREEDIIFTCSKHGNRGQTKWLPCLFCIIIYLYLLMYTITQCFYIHVYSLELNLIVYIFNCSQVHMVSSTIALQSSCNCYVQTINRMVAMTTIYTCSHVCLQVHV